MDEKIQFDILKFCFILEFKQECNSISYDGKID